MVGLGSSYHHYANRRNIVSATLMHIFMLFMAMVTTDHAVKILLNPFIR